MSARSSESRSYSTQPLSYGSLQDAVDGPELRRSAGLTVPTSVNDIRALRIVELVNDYRTLLLHIMELIDSTSTDGIGQHSFDTILQCHTAAQRLLTGTYDLSKITSLEDKSHGEDAATVTLRE